MHKTLWHWGRLFYSIPLSLTGLIYLLRPQSSVETLTSFIPGGVSLIYVAGFFWLIFGLALALDFKTRFVAWAVIVLLGAYQVVVHIPAATNGEHLAVVWFELLRDLSLIGGALFVLALDYAFAPHARRDHVTQHSLIP